MKKSESEKRLQTGYHLFKAYSKVSFIQGLYAMIRMMLVSFPKIEQAVPKEGKILDLGCGNGVFSHFMYLTSTKRSIVGIDYDKKRIQIAQQTVDGKIPLQFSVTDVNKVDFDNIQIMTLIDLLHHMPFHEQERLLKIIFDNLDMKGIVVVKDLKKSPQWKYLLHYIHDTISYKGKSLFFRSSKDMVALLEKIGFNVEVYDIGFWNIYPHVVYRCEKRSTMSQEV